MSFSGHKNFSYSLVATAPSPAISGTSLIVGPGDGAKFPAVPFPATIWPISVQPTTANAEIVVVTNIATDTLTITRAQESTSARTVIVGDQIAATITAKSLTDIEAATATTDATITTSDITTNDVSTSKHGFTPKAPNITSQFLRGDATWAAIWTVVTTTATGTQSGAWVTLTGHTEIRCNNASLLSIAGLPAGFDGQMVRLVSINAQVDALHQSGSEATVAARLINHVTVGNTSAAAGVGTFDYQYDLTTARWRLIFHEQGAYITPTYAAGDYTGNGAMTWTVDSGDVTTCAYWLKGRHLEVLLDIETSSVAGTPNSTLQRAIPGGFTSAKQTRLVTQTVDNAALPASGLLFVLAAGTTIGIFRDFAGSNWTAAVNTSAVRGSIFFEVQ